MQGQLLKVILMWILAYVRESYAKNKISLLTPPETIIGPLWNYPHTEISTVLILGVPAEAMHVSKLLLILNHC